MSDSSPSSFGPAHRQALIAVIILAVFLVGSFVVVAIAQGIGSPSVPDGEVAVVEDLPAGTITAEDFDAALQQTAAGQGLRQVPAADDPQYEALAEAAVSELILSQWVLGEASERGIEVTESEIDDQLAAVKEQQFRSNKQFRRYLEQSGFTIAEARERIELQLISDRIQDAVLPADAEPEVSEEEIQTFYDENPEQFEQPESRDVRVVLTKTEEEASEALAALEEDSSPKGFDEVANEFSIDEATRHSGGLREAVVEGQSEASLDQQIFNAPEGELVGPFETEAGFYVIQVEGVTPASKTSLEEAREQIRQTLVSARQQEITQSFQQSFQAKWTARTVCAEDYRIDRCSNAAPPPDPCTEEVAETEDCDAPVASTRPIEPGTAGTFGATAPEGLPQGPITPQSETAEDAVPAGTTVPSGTGP